MPRLNKPSLQLCVLSGLECYEYGLFLSLQGIMTLEVPEWLNETFLAACLQEDDGCGEKIAVIKFTPLPVVAEGNNFASCLLRVRVEFRKGGERETHEASLIVKYPLKDDAETNVFDFKDVEYKFYHQILPLARTLNCDGFAPKCYVSPDKSVLVMEDLKEQGFLMLDKSKQLDYDHCCLYITTSASFHAASIVVHKVNADLVESVGDEKLFSEQLKITHTYKTLMKFGLECTSDFMEKMELKKYAKLVREAESYLYNLVIDAHKRGEGLNSLNQGDPWIPNMLFKYDDSGKVSELKLLDFQALRYGSPSNDLVFFLWTSANHDVRENRLEDIYHLYCDTLNKKLQDLNCTESLMYSDLLKAVKALLPVMLFIVVVYTPLQLSPSVVDVADLLSNEKDKSGKLVNKLTKYYTQNYCEHFLSRYLRQLDCMGVFEYLESHNI